MLDKGNKTWSDRKHFLWWPITFTKYRIENGRLYITTGVLSTKEEECLLYRMMDITFERGLGNRICKTGTIKLATRDASNPVIVLENIAKAQEVKDAISMWIEQERLDKKVVGRDMYGASSHMEDIEADMDQDHWN